MAECGADSFLEDLMARLYLVYQPIVGGNPLRIHGVEVLSRFRPGSSDQPPPSPGEIVGRIESAGQIEVMTRCVFERLTSDLHRVVINPFWPLHVNISPLQVSMDPGRLHLERDLEKFWGHHRNSLILEITENRHRLSKKKWGSIGEWMEDLTRRDGDLGWFLDDFGRGENFDVLDLPFQGIKIDRDFVISDSPRPIRAIARIAEMFGWSLVAEGVESREELKRLKPYKIDYFQGNLAYRPMPIEKLRLIGSKGLLEIPPPGSISHTDSSFGVLK